MEVTAIGQAVPLNGESVFVILFEIELIASGEVGRVIEPTIDITVRAACGVSVEGAVAPLDVGDGWWEVFVGDGEGEGNKDGLAIPLWLNDELSLVVAGRSSREITVDVAATTEEGLDPIQLEVGVGQAVPLDGESILVGSVEVEPFTPGEAGDVVEVSVEVSVRAACGVSVEESVVPLDVGDGWWEVFVGDDEGEGDQDGLAIPLWLNDELSLVVAGRSSRVLEADSRVTTNPGIRIVELEVAAIGQAVPLDGETVLVLLFEIELVAPSVVGGVIEPAIDIPVGAACGVPVEWAVAPIDVRDDWWQVFVCDGEGEGGRGWTGNTLVAG